MLNLSIRSRLPDPRDSYFFRNDYGSEALHSARKEVEKLYPNRPIETEVHGDFRAKDTFSLRCVDIESELEKGIPAQDVLSFVKQWAPVKRTDLHADDIASGSIEYNQYDPAFLKTLLKGDKQNSLPLKAAKRALHQLTKNGAPQAGRVPLSEGMKAALGPLEQVDVFKPLPESRKQKTPRVVCASNILHYGDPMKQNQFAQNLQDTCAQGSRLVLGPSEDQLRHLSGMLRRHGFTPDREANLTLIRQRTENPICLKEMENHPPEEAVYLKTEQ